MVSILNMAFGVYAEISTMVRCGVRFAVKTLKQYFASSTTNIRYTSARRVAGSFGIR